MKKLRILILTVLLIFSTTACDTIHTTNNTEALLDLGLEVTKTMQEMVYAEEYISLYTTSNTFADELVTFQATDYDAPIAVYSVEMPGTKEILTKVGGGNAEDYDALSDNLKEQLGYRASFASVISAINAQRGTTTIALCSILVATKYNKIELDKPVTYVYVFENGVPIAVTITESGYANGQFLVLGDAKSEEDIRRVFDTYSCNVEKIG